MTKTRRTLAVAATLLALGGGVAGATSAMAAGHHDSYARHVHHMAAQASDPTVEVSAVRSDDTTGTAVGLGTPAYLSQLKTPQDVDAAQTQLVEFMKARGLQVQLVHDEDGRPCAEYDPFVDANLDAVQAFYDARATQG